VNTSRSTPAGAPSAPDATRETLLEPFISAVCVTLREMAGTEVVARSVHETALNNSLTDISAAVHLTSTTDGFLVVSFPERSAYAVARRVLDGVTTELDESMIRDCVGEIANVVAGQAKALLAETPFHFVFSMPKVVVGPDPELQPKQGLECFVVTLTSDVGEFAVQLAVALERR
jgi:chemotaxis protein CheX